MERFLIAAVGVVAIILALILAEHYRARGPASAAAPRTKGAAALGAVVGIVVVAALGAAGFAAFEWRSVAAQRHALDAQRSALAVAQREFAAQKESAYLARPPSEEPAPAAPQARRPASTPPPFKPAAPGATQAGQPSSAPPQPKQAGPVTHRARVAATASLGGALIIKAGEISLAARYHLENKGDAPAADMRVASSVILRPELDVRAAEETVCGRLAGGTDTRPALRRALPPQQSVALSRIEGNGANIGRGRLMRVAGGGLKFWWVGCVAYHTLGDPDQYHSGFVYRIAESDGQLRRLVPISLADQIIPKQRLVVIPYRGAGMPD